MLAVAALGTLSFWLFKDKGTKPPLSPIKPADSKSPPKILDRYDDPIIDQEPVALALNGVALPESTASISVRMPSLVSGVMVHVGQTVHAGQAVIQLDQSELFAQERIAISALRSSEAAVRSARELGEFVVANR